MLLSTAAFICLIRLKNAEVIEKKKPSVDQLSIKPSPPVNEPSSLSGNEFSPLSVSLLFFFLFFV